MNFEQWDVLSLEAYLLCMADKGPEQFGVVISNDVVRTAANRLWILQIPRPRPERLLDGDIEVPELRDVLPFPRPILRTSSIFAVYEGDLQDRSQRIATLPEGYRQQVTDLVHSFLPPPKRGWPWH